MYAAENQKIMWTKIIINTIPVPIKKYLDNILIYLTTVPGILKTTSFAKEVNSDSYGYYLVNIG